MDEREAIEVLKVSEDIREQIPMLAPAYDAAVKALEKQIPKKIVFNSEDDREYEDFICPNCKDILQQRRKGACRITIYKYKHCHNCGQKLDWRDENEYDGKI